MSFNLFAKIKRPIEDINKDIKQVLQIYHEKENKDLKFAYDTYEKILKLSLSGKNIFDKRSYDLDENVFRQKLKLVMNSIDKVTYNYQDMLFEKLDSLIIALSEHFDWSTKAALSYKWGGSVPAVKAMLFYHDKADNSFERFETCNDAKFKNYSSSFLWGLLEMAVGLTSIPLAALDSIIATPGIIGAYAGMLEIKEIQDEIILLLHDIEVDIYYHELIQKYFN
jgi:hypothetical protein